MSLHYEADVDAAVAYISKYRGLDGQNALGWRQTLSVPSALRTGLDDVVLLKGVDYPQDDDSIDDGNDGAALVLAVFRERALTGYVELIDDRPVILQEAGEFLDIEPLGDDELALVREVVAHMRDDLPRS